MGRSTAVFTMYADQAQKMYKRSASDVRVFPLLDTYADAIVQLPDYVKQALEHESYSKIQGIRELASKLANSLSGAILKVEQARMALLSGKGISEETIATLSKLADVDRLMDNRNFELLPEIGGKRPSTRDMTDLGGVVSDSWVRTHARLLAALGKFAKGEAVEHVELPEGQAVSFALSV